MYPRSVRDGGVQPFPALLLVGMFRIRMCLVNVIHGLFGRPDRVGEEAEIDDGALVAISVGHDRRRGRIFNDCDLKTLLDKVMVDGFALG